MNEYRSNGAGEQISTGPAQTTGGMMDQQREEILWTVVATGTAIAAGVAIRRGLAFGWERATGNEPPKNPASPLTDWREAAGWMLTVGAAVGAGRLLARRAAAAGWQRTTGRFPRDLLSRS